MAFSPELLRQDLTPEEITQANQKLEDFCQSVTESIAKAVSESIDKFLREVEKNSKKATPIHQAFAWTLMRSVKESSRTMDEEIQRTVKRNLRYVVQAGKIEE